MPFYRSRLLLLASLPASLSFVLALSLCFSVCLLTHLLFFGFIRSRSCSNTYADLAGEIKEVRQFGGIFFELLYVCSLCTVPVH